MAGAQGRARLGAPPGREDDLRDVLVLLDYQRVVAVTGGCGIGRTTFLRAVADRYRVKLVEGVAPKTVARGDLVVLDDADALSDKALKGLVRRVLKADGRILIGARTAVEVPPPAVVHRLAGLSGEAGATILGSQVSGRRALVQDIADSVRGHPGLLALAAGILGGKGGPRDLARVRAALAKAAYDRWVAPLPEPLRAAAGLLAAAGGWLPATLEILALSEHAPALAREGLAELVDGGVEASPILLVAGVDIPGDEVLLETLGGLAELRPLARASIRLAEAHLLHRLGDDGPALGALRDAHRAARGALRSEAFSRGLAGLAEGEPSPLTACARLSGLIHGGGPAGLPEDRATAVEALLDEGHLEDPEVCEARTYLAYLDLEAEGPDTALAGLVRAAELAASAGDLYAEAQALIWQGWVHVLNDAPQLAAQVTERAARLARKADAPVLQSRALYCLSRADLAEEAYDTAGRRLQQALRLTRRHRLDEDQTVILDALADLAGRQGRPSEAAEHLAAADAILARAGSLPRKGALSVTRAQVALRRGHVAEARRILARAEVQVVGEAWRRDLLAAEVALAAGAHGEAREALITAARHPASARSWLWRRAGVATGLLREGIDPGIDLAELEADPVAAMLLARGRGDVTAAGARLADLEAEADDLPGAEGLLLREAVAVRLLEGRVAEAAEAGRRLRDRLAEMAAPTATMLLLEALEVLLRGDIGRATRRAVAAHRSAVALGHERMAQLALELLVVCHLAGDRPRGLRWILARTGRYARRTKSPGRSARLAALQLAAAARFPDAGLEAPDDARARAAADPLAAALVATLDGGPATGPLSHLAGWLRGLVLEGTAVPPGGPAPGAEVAVELTLDGARKEVVLAGGKRVAFARRRVLWRLLWFLHEAEGGTIEPETLYVAAWELPFNPSRLNSLYVGVRRLRLLVEPDPSAPRIIMAGQGGGYYMDVRRVNAFGTSPFEEDEAD